MDMKTKSQAPKFGHLDTSYQAAGGFEGLSKLVNAFYDHMEAKPFAAKIRNMHQPDLAPSRDKLICFLSGWLGGPRLYSEKYGAISIPGVHAHLDIGEQEKQAWLDCMQLAIDEQEYSPEFADYLITQLSLPANRIQTVCQR